MTIKIKILFFFALMGALLSVLIGDLWLMIQNGHHLTALQKRRFDSRLVAEELRQSSDELTRMARTYVATGDQRFLDYFNRIISIRDGSEPRPENYQDFFWDFICAYEDYPIKTSRSVSIIKIMEDLNFTPEELALLSEAKARSDRLVRLEIQAFNASRGLYPDGDGGYTRKGTPDRDLALQILFSESYHIAKAGIMEKVDAFFKALDTRTVSEVHQGEEKQKLLLAVASLVAVILVGMSSVGYVLFRKDIIRPLNGILKWVKQMQNSRFDFDAEGYKKDEFGILANAFAEMAGKVETHITELELISNTDPLTGINNRIALDKALYTEKYKFDRYETPCAVIMLDVDFFKQVNDCYGHIVGDRVLIKISNIMMNMTRESDIIGRWGGEEFMLICPNTTLEKGRILAELIRKRIDEHEFAVAGHVTVSLGVSSFFKNDTIEDAVKRADSALYQAKSDGRNQVC